MRSLGLGFFGFRLSGKETIHDKYAIQTNSKYSEPMMVSESAVWIAAAQEDHAMTIRKIRPWAGLVASLALFASGAFAVGRQGPPPPPPLGGPLPGLTQTQLQDFENGKANFIETEGINDGLGPVFNGVSCVQCHHAGAPGGASADLTVSRVTRIGAMV